MKGCNLAVVLALTMAFGRLAVAAGPDERLVFHSLPGARFQFTGPVGDRVGANLDEWLLRAPQANPGMLEMFRLRDRQPVPQLVPWAGEFVGKYLISAVQALRMSDDPRLRQQVAAVIAELIAGQAEDGYLGPFPKDARLLRNWDLWGHYHVIHALALWHEQTGDAAALASARKAADLVCRTYLDTGHRVIEAGDPEMNMAILTGLAMLHRITGEPRYLRMAREVEKDWQHAGDYLRAGLDGREFFQGPRPRWESLHDLQGLVELWRITGDPKYREAFVHHWRSIRRWDRRNTGGFSSGEQATGNPYAPTAIETCCTVAWMALTVDYLRLTGEPAAADDLELATLNGGLGAQHPSGRWWTYNTPMDGVREASAHTIVFQARAGTPELNCCSVNGPRVLGMLSEWALMSAPDGLILNWLGAGRFTGALANGASVTLTSSADAWREGRTEWRVESGAADPFCLRVRVPGWARGAQVNLNGERVAGVTPGRYLALTRRWKSGDRLELSFGLPLRSVAGANEAAGKVSLYRGPILLAYDQACNSFDEQAIPALNVAALGQARVIATAATANASDRLFQPWLLVEVPVDGGRALRLVDFASAGARGTHYRSWLVATPAPAAPAFAQKPSDGARVPPGQVRFQWRAVRGTGAQSYRIEFATNEDFAPVLWSTNTSGKSLTLNAAALLAVAGPADLADTSAARRRLYWRVVTGNGQSETLPDVPASWFILDPGAPPQTLVPEAKLGPDGEIIVHALRADSAPKFGDLQPGPFADRDAEGTEVNGRNQRLVYPLSAWPDEDFTVAVRVRIREMPPGRIGQVFSAWCAGMDDPLRLVVEGGKLFARVEAGGVFSTAGVPVKEGRWYAVAAVRRGGTLTLHLDGQVAGSCAVPEFTSTQARDCALGGNPHFTGNEFLAARFADFAFYGRALSAAEIQRLGAGH